MISQVERVADISDSLFRFQFLSAQVPLVISGCIEQWPARKKWNLDYFASQFPEKKLQFSGKQWVLGEFIKTMSRGSESAPYLKEVKLDEQFPELMPDIGALRFTLSNLLNSRWLPRSMRISKGIKALFIGGAGSGFGKLHWDYSYLHVFISQIRGEKDFVLYAPEDTPYLYASSENPNKSMIEDFNAFDPLQFPDVAKASPIRLTIGEGDTLFIPAGWWHATKMRDTSISVAESSLDTSNWCQRGDWYIENYRASGVSEWKLAALKIYLRAVRPFLRR
jgi:histone arginine demethylase JMJD6